MFLFLHKRLNTAQPCVWASARNGLVRGRVLPREGMAKPATIALMPEEPHLERRMGAAHPPQDGRTSGCGPAGQDQRRGWEGGFGVGASYRDDLRRGAVEPLVRPCPNSSHAWSAATKNHQQFLNAGRERPCPQPRGGVCLSEELGF